MARLYADENFPLPVVKNLRMLGHDVLTIEEDGKAHRGYPDDLVLADATRHERAVLTMNRKHFRQLHRKSPEHSGIILCTYNSDFVELSSLIHEAIHEHDSLAGQVIRIYRSAA